MGDESGAERDVLSVSHSKVSTRLFHKFRHGRVVDVADLWEKVVFNLKVQTAKEPAFYAAAAGKVYRGFDLMNGPGIFYRVGTCQRQREFGFRNAVCQLEHNADRDTSHDYRHAIEQEYSPNSVDQQRHHKGRRHKQGLGTDEAHQLPALWPRHSVGADPAPDHITEIVVQVP